MLHIQPGETIIAGVLEGERPIRQLMVAGLVDDWVGVSAYMERHALNRLMQEGDTISGAYLAVGSSRLENLYALLKQTPAIASVTLRQSTIDRFQQTIAETRNVMNVITVVFSCIIAFGVVYNSARIALSERSRELATLRIIGFSRPQVAMVLLGEQALLTLVAIPIGFVMGYGLIVLLSITYNTELYRFPVIVNKASYAFAVIVITLAALVTGLLIRHQLNRLDLIAVLKTRE
jgi:putative ABC transport system permease protein